MNQMDINTKIFTTIGIFLLAIFVAPNNLLSQQITYTYDPSGNRKTRSYTVIRKKAESVSEEIDSANTPSFEVKAFPNPFSDEVTISIDSDEETEENFRIMVLSETGQLIQKLSMNQKQKRINTTGLAKGKYILRLFRKEESEEFILIKN
jgi:hypothetical protein